MFRKRRARGEYLRRGLRARAMTSGEWAGEDSNSQLTNETFETCETQHLFRTTSMFQTSRAK